MSIRTEHAQMLAEIELEARQTARWTGRNSFSAGVMNALAAVPRDVFVPPVEKSRAFHNGPLPIGYQQTISQPYIVALMTDLLDLTRTSRVLEIGTGSGYQTAVLAELASMVYTVEIVAQLANQAEQRLRQLGYGNIRIKHADGYEGWAQYAPYDGIIVTAAAEIIPEPLVQQLKPGSRMVIPVGERMHGQDLVLIVKNDQGVLSRTKILPVVFVPFTRQAAAGENSTA